MGEFEIQFRSTALWADKIGGYSAELGQQKGRVESVSRQLAFKGDYRGVEQALSRIAENLNTQKTQMKQYGGMLENIVKAYQGAESSITGSITPTVKVEKALEAASDLLMNLLSEFGIVGSSASAVLKFYESSMDGISTKDILKLLKDADGVLGKAAGELGKSQKERNWLNALFGDSSQKAWEKIGIKPKDSIGTKWGKYFKDQADDYMFSAAESAGKNIKAATKYAGAVLSFAIAALDNKAEQGGVMNGRAWGETITETILNAGEGFFIGGIATIALGAGASVLAVGAVSVVAAWGIDQAYKAIFGSENGLIEDVSDLICDAAVKAGNAVSKWAESTWNSVTDFFSGRNKKPAYAR